jgi:hypothetical protein
MIIVLYYGAGDLTMVSAFTPDVVPDPKTQELVRRRLIA